MAVTSTSAAAVTVDRRIWAPTVLAIELITIVPAPLSDLPSFPPAPPAPAAAMPTSKGFEDASTVIRPAAEETVDLSMNAAIALLTRL